MTKYYVVLHYFEPNGGPMPVETRTETIRAKSLDALRTTLKDEYEMLKSASVSQIRGASITIYRDYFTRKAIPLATIALRDSPKDAEKREKNMERIVRQCLASMTRH